VTADPRILCLAALALVGLSSCQVAQFEPPTRPEPRPAVLGPVHSPASRALAHHYAKVEADLVSRGLLRIDGGADIPVSRRTLVDNFLRIALYDEYVSNSGYLVARETRSRLRRWEQPIRMGIYFGASVTPEQRRKDRAEISAFASRLSRLTGLPVSMTSPEDANYLVLVVDEDERRRIGPELDRLVPGIDPAAQQTIAAIPRSTFCLVLAFSRGNSSTYTNAVAVIRSEHPDRLRSSCVHEELAQGMGLANDSPAARPSIFNDDEEFAFLTQQDELMLRILYDRRLRPGMTETEARPIVETIVAELLGGES